MIVINTLVTVTCTKTRDGKKLCVCVCVKSYTNDLSGESGRRRLDALLNK